MSRLRCFSLVVLCLVALTNAQVYDGELQPFSYAELQATVTPNSVYSPGSTMFITPESMHSGSNIPTAFPFQQPAMPVDMRNRVAPTHAAAAQAMRFSQINPYDSNAYQQQRAMMHQFVSQGPQAPAMVESLSSIHRIASTNQMNNMLANGGAVATPAAPTIPLGSASQQASPYPPSDMQAMSASRTVPLPSAASPSPLSQTDLADASAGSTDPAAFDAARFSQTQASSELAAQAEAQAAAMAEAQASESAAATASHFPGSSSIPPPPASISSPEHSHHSLSGSLSGSSHHLSGSLHEHSGSHSLMPHPHTPEPASAHGSSSFSSHSGSSSLGGVTPISHPKPLHKCVPSTKNSCVVDFDPSTIPWTVVTVPHLEGCSGSSVSTGHSGSSSSSQSACSGSSQGSLSGSSSSASLSGSSSHEHHHHEYSTNPEIARAQKAYYDKQDEVLREKRWVSEVERIIAEYQYKIKNVQKHTRLEQAHMRKDKKNIMSMIKAEKSAKLEAELHAALESLKKLETTSSALNSKMTELSQTKAGLRSTITKIQRVIGSSPSSIASSSSLIDLGEHIDTDQHLNAQEEANNGAKQLFSSLLELLGKTKQRHSAMRSTSSLAQRLAQKLRHGKASHRGEEEEETRHTDLNHITARASAIAQKYAEEENQRLHTNLPLRALAAREYKRADEDRDDFLD